MEKIAQDTTIPIGQKHSSSTEENFFRFSGLILKKIQKQPSRDILKCS